MTGLSDQAAEAAIAAACRSCTCRPSATRRPASPRPPPAGSYLPGLPGRGPRRRGRRARRPPPGPPSARSPLPAGQTPRRVRLHSQRRLNPATIATLAAGGFIRQFMALPLRATAEDGPCSAGVLGSGWSCYSGRSTIRRAHRRRPARSRNRRSAWAESPGGATGCPGRGSRRSRTGTRTNRPAIAGPGLGRRADLAGGEPAVGQLQDRLSRRCRRRVMGQDGRGQQPDHHQWEEPTERRDPRPIDDCRRWLHIRVAPLVDRSVRNCRG